MNSIVEHSRSVEVVLKTDILVAGQGPGGLTAALVAARAGAKTVLLDRNGRFGSDIAVHKELSRQGARYS